MAIDPAIVADLYPIERRSFAMGIVLVYPPPLFLSVENLLITPSSFKLSHQLSDLSAVASLHNVSAGAGHIGFLLLPVAS